MPHPMISIPAAMLALLPVSAAVAQSAPLAAPAPAASPAASPTLTAAEQAAKDRENEVICHREIETASLVKVRKTCHTRAQWAYIQAENQRNSQDFIAANTNRPSGN